MSQYDQGSVEVLIFSIECLRKTRFMNVLTSHTLSFKSKTIKTIFAKRHKNYFVGTISRDRFSQNKFSVAYASVCMTVLCNNAKFCIIFKERCDMHPLLSVFFNRLFLLEFLIL